MDVEVIYMVLETWRFIYTHAIIFKWRLVS